MDMNMNLNQQLGTIAGPRETATQAPLAAADAAREQIEEQNEPRLSLFDPQNQDTVNISDRARLAASELDDPSALQNTDSRLETDADAANAQTDQAAEAGREDDDEKANDEKTDPAQDKYTPEEERQLEELRRTDQEVRAHEQAHVAAGGNNPRYDYQVGPDGQQYAVGGTTDIQVQAQGDDPDSKLAQAQKLRNAALAPADPSGQDLSVAGKANKIEAEARMEKAQQQLEEMENKV